MKKILLVLFGILLLSGCTTQPVDNSKLYPDVKVSRLIRVIDGDTFVCDIDEHSAIAGKAISIRIRNIDTPELWSRNLEERKATLEEKQRLENFLAAAKNIELKNLGRDKYVRINTDIYLDGEALLPKLNQRYRLDNKPSLDKIPNI